MAEDSSPPSSPSLGPVDSSPPESPSIQPTYVLNSPPHSPIIDPFSGAAKATRRPPQYERRYPPSASTSPSYGLSPPALRSSLKRVFGTEGDTDAEARGSPVKLQRQRMRTDSTSSLEPRVSWDQAITQAVDDGKLVTILDLSHHALTFIPASIEDLGKMVVLTRQQGDNVSLRWVETQQRQLGRSVTMPAFPGSSASNTIRTGSDRSLFRRSPPGPDQQQIRLFLPHNSITMLPKELFELRNLTVLSLHHNSLIKLPPEIAKLVNLRDLNISYNKLEYLPSELLGMQLALLNVVSNPFRPQLQDPAPCLVAFPSLTELCLRALLTPSLQTSGGTMLSDTFQLPLPEGRYPQSLVEILSACAPGSVSRPAPAFLDKQPPTTSVFAHPAEQKLIWTRDVAGISLPEEVPLLWRGCMPGCLDFLDGVESGAGMVDVDMGEKPDVVPVTPERMRRVQFRSQDYDFSDSGDDT
ncbi:hypothetical protein PUNSTDRAFT_142973 [Punctularia strigosozonata HHB-11173 SS5]|uniref:uncharacterized protein n=1 Tax=Punctularia strigosozonata (strain HHB-11173) TaxID=741275 RepID=UPI0004416F7C|nr:uncharacterized protein PUNSTDRAFT_142973 [Punctularia strigosozonata HHB-11173 SS5]EIN09397.1 hypothetical protein PUNSTDRAFT_142973 [Punctularia strigosozonata HHB-11173 SS5]